MFALNYYGGRATEYEDGGVELSDYYMTNASIDTVREAIVEASNTVNQSLADFEIVKKYLEERGYSMKNIEVETFPMLTSKGNRVKYDSYKRFITEKSKEKTK